FRGAGAIALSEPAAGRRALAAAFGTSAAIDPAREEVARAFERCAGGPPDVVFECVGAPGLIQQAVALARPKGEIVVVGVCMGEDHFQPASAIQKGLTLRFSIGYRARHFQPAVELLAPARIQPPA